METYGSGLFGEGTWGGRNVIRFTLSGGDDDLTIIGGHTTLGTAATSGGGALAVTGRKGARDDAALSGGGEPTGFIPLYNQIPGGGFLYETGTKHGIASVGLVLLGPPGSPGSITGSYYGEAIWGEAVFGAGAELRIHSGGSLAATGSRTNYPRPPDTNPTIDPPLSGGGEPDVLTRKQAHGSSWTIVGGGYLHAPMVNFRLSGGGTGQITAKKFVRRPAGLLRGGGATKQVGHKKIYGGFGALSGGGNQAFVGEKLAPGWHLSAGGQGQASATKISGGSFASSDGGDATAPVIQCFLQGGGFLTAIGIKAPIVSLTLTDGGDVTAAGIKQGLLDLVLTDGGDLLALGTKTALAQADLSGGGDGTSTATKYVLVPVATSDGGDLLAVASKYTSGDFLLTGGGRMSSPRLVHVHITGGGDTVMLGVHGGVGVGVDISGGGGCWGPWPEVLDPKVLLIDHESKVAQLSTGVFQRTLPLALV